MTTKQSEFLLSNLEGCSISLCLGYKFTKIQCFICMHLLTCLLTYQSYLSIHPSVRPSIIILPMLGLTFTIFEWKNEIILLPGKKESSMIQLIGVTNRFGVAKMLHCMVYVFHSVIHKLDQVVQYFEEMFLRHFYNMLKIHPLKNTSS